MAAGRDLATVDQDACVRVAVMLTIYNQKAYHIMAAAAAAAVTAAVMKKVPNLMKNNHLRKK